MDLTTLTPVEIDTLLVEIWDKKARVNNWIVSNQKTLDRYKHRGGAIQYQIDECLASIAKYKAKYAELREQEAPFTAEWDRRGHWSRHWHVANTNGHIHHTTRCSTCYASTRYAFRPELSGINSAELVAIVGEVACTVCFPEAPTFKGFGDGTSQLAKLSEVEKAAKAAEKAERAAKKAAKAITQPDGQPLREMSWRSNETGKGNVIASLVSAQRGLVDSLFEVLRIGLDDGRKERTIPLLAQADYLAEAIGAKVGETAKETLKGAWEKAEKKFKKYCK